MSVDTEKVINGTSLFYSVEILPNKCKFTTEEAFTKREVVTGEALTSGFTGLVTTTGGDPGFFTNSNPHLKIDDELMKVDTVSQVIGFVFNGSNNRIEIP